MIRLLSLAALALALAACQSTPATRTVTVEVPVEVVVPLDPRLTAPEAKPRRPPNRCRDARDRPTICNRDLADWLNEYDATVDKLNAKLGRILSLQPKPAEPGAVP